MRYTNSHYIHSHSKQHLDGSAVLWVPNDMLYNALSMGKKTPKTVPSPGISLPRRRTEAWP